MAKPKIKGANTKESFHCQLEAYQNSSHQCMHDKIEKIKALLQLRYFALIGDIMIIKKWICTMDRILLQAVSCNRISEPSSHSINHQRALQHSEPAYRTVQGKSLVVQNVVVTRPVKQGNRWIAGLRATTSSTRKIFRSRNEIMMIHTDAAFIAWAAIKIDNTDRHT